MENFSLNHDIRIKPEFKSSNETKFTDCKHQIPNKNSNFAYSNVRKNFIK
jgi:hypothetical protein